MSDLPRLILPIGDPAGIGVEVILKALKDPNLAQSASMTLLGDFSLIEQTWRQLAKQVELPLLTSLEVIDQPLAEPIQAGQPTAITGAASFTWLEAAIQLTLAGKFEGIVTAPIAKSAWLAAGHHYPGQTELLAQMARVSRYGMMFAAQSPHTGWPLRALLATTHIPLQQVSQTLSSELLTAKLDLLVAALEQDFGILQPRVAISGLNPHSGEQGQLGQEEQDWLIPWLEQERLARPQIELIGPVPPDTLWVGAGQAWFGTSKKNFTAATLPDAYLALYHDQGLIPVKLMAFDRAVNLTIGLPFVRTSPDHGTAFDIAGQGKADATSMQAAIRLATQLVLQRRQRVAN